MRKFSYSPLWLARSSVGLALYFIAAKFSRTGPSGAAPRESLLSSLKSAYERYAHRLLNDRMGACCLLLWVRVGVTNLGLVAEYLVIGEVLLQDLPRSCTDCDSRLTHHLHAKHCPPLLALDCGSLYLHA